MGLQVDQLRWMAERHGDETAYAQLATKDLLTFARWDTTSNRLARGLADAGIEPGERVVLHLENEHLDRWLIAYAAIHKTGAVAVPTNTRLTARELSTILAHAEPAALITSTRLRPTLDEALAAGPTSPRLVIHADDHQSWCPTLATDDSAFQVAGGRRRPGRHPLHLRHHRVAERRGRPPPQHPPDPQRRAALDRQLVDPLLAAVDLRRHQLRLQPHEDGHARASTCPASTPIRGSTRWSSGDRPWPSSCRPWCSCCSPTTGSPPPTCRASRCCRSARPRWPRRCTAAWPSACPTPWSRTTTR